MPPVVTTVTARPVSSDELSLADYSDIYDEIRRKMSLRQFVDQIRSQYSIAWWSKYERSETPLTRQAKQELRAAVGLPQLPPTIAEATAGADPDATVYQVGQDPANRLILVGADITDPLTMRINGHLETIDESDEPQQEAAVTPVTSPKRPRTPTKAIRVSPTAFQRLQAHRQALGMSWDAFLTALLGEEA